MRLEEVLDTTAARAPDEPAVNLGDEGLTWRALRERALQIAAALRARGVGAGDLVGVWRAKSPDTIATMFGALYAGAAYVPINVDTRRPVVDSIARHLALVITDERVEEPGAVYAAAEELTASPSDLPRVGSPDDLAYVHFTSGSTGTPKGVAITHRAAAAYMDAVEALVPLEAGDVIAQHAPLAFDLASFDIHLAVRRAARLALVSEGVAVLLGSFVKFLREEAPTLLYTVPTTLHRLGRMQSLESLRITSLRHVVFAGEPADTARLAPLRRSFPEATFHHWYGSTEAALVSSVAYPPGVPLPDTLPLGTVIPGMTLLTRDDDGNVRPMDGAGEGELLVSGALLFSGYHGDAERTAAALVSVGDDPRPWYRTRDRVRWAEDGTLHYAGRVDRMVKVRGMRVEPGEVESALAACGAQDSAVVTVPDAEIGARLIAFVAGEVDLGALRRALRARLEAHKVPSLVAIDRLPTTATGKIDRKALVARVEGSPTPAERGRSS